MRQLKRWERHILRFLLGYLIWNIIWLVGDGGIYLWIGTWYINYGFVLGSLNSIISAALAAFIIFYLTGVLVFWLAKNVSAGFFKPLHQTIEAKREYKHWLEEKKKQKAKK